MNQEPKNIENNSELKSQEVISENLTNEIFENTINQDCEYDNWYSDSPIF